MKLTFCAACGSKDDLYTIIWLPDRRATATTSAT